MEQDLESFRLRLKFFYGKVKEKMMKLEGVEVEGYELTSLSKESTKG